MHRWFLLLLIALLPLRGWVGDAVAAEMLVQHSAAAQHGSASPATQDHRLPHHDCAEHADAGTSGEAAAQTDVSACAACASCQVCSSVAMAWTAPAGLLPALAPMRPGSDGPRYASADPARELRPPIA